MLYDKDLPGYAFGIIQAVGFIEIDGQIYSHILKNKAGGTRLRGVDNQRAMCVT